MSFGGDLLRARGRAPSVAHAPQFVEVELVGLARCAAAELADDRQADWEIVAVEREGARCRELWTVLDKTPFGQAEEDLVRVVGSKEAALLGGRGDSHALAILVLHENAVELRAFAFTAVDPQGQMLAELVELADLDRGA